MKSKDRGGALPRHHFHHLIALTIACLCWLAGLEARASSQARELGVPLNGQAGKWNAITDVPGVLVGHTTIIRGDGALKVGQGPVRTGVTAILPAGRQYRPVFAASSTLNGNGEMTGTHWIGESGFLEEPILLTNTHSIGAVHEAAIAWRAHAGFHAPGKAKHQWASLPVVAETWDGRLNDIHGFHVRRRHVFAALNEAQGGEVPEGNVGGGTGMVCHRFKGGIGTSSRLTRQGYTVGVLVQANYGLREELTVAGVPVGKEIPDLGPEMTGSHPAAEGSSIIAIIATDAPVLPHQLKRMAARVPSGLARVGGIGRNSSGDLFLAFSTHRPEPVTLADGKKVLQTSFLPNGEMDPLFQAVVEGVEEAILNALLSADTMVGINDNTVHALPHDRLRAILKTHGRLVQ